MNYSSVFSQNHSVMEIPFEMHSQELQKSTNIANAVISLIFHPLSLHTHTYVATSDCLLEYHFYCVLDNKKRILIFYLKNKFSF